jgi:prepilin-type N-terminal cleavage/methylation domain-containing protein
MKGFTIVELLVAMSITLLVAAATLSLIGPAHDAFQVQPETADLQQRVRVGIDTLQRDLLMAGAGMYAAGSVGPLHHAVAPVMPYLAFGSSSDPTRGTYFRPDAISLMFVPSTPSQATLAGPLGAASLEIDLASYATCPPPIASQVCGLEAGDELLVFDRNGGWEVFAVDRVVSATGLRLRGPLPTRGFASHSSVTEVTAVTYALKADPAAGAFQLVRSEALGAAQPVLDHVVKLEFHYFGEPLPPRLIDDEGEGRPRASYGPSPPGPGEDVDEWPPGENCAFALVDGQHQTRLLPLGAANDLVEIAPAALTDGPWCPDAQAWNRFDADLLRIRRVRFMLRVETALVSLRGPAGRLFTNAGSARAGGRYVPDLEIQFDVTPRNLNLSR